MTKDDNDDLLQRALVAAPIRRDAELTRQVLTRAGLVSSSCASADELCDEIKVGAGIVILAQEMLSPRFLACLREVVEAQPPWSDLPIIVLTRSQEAIEPLVEQMQSLANVSFLERPVRMRTLSSAVGAALRARRRQIEIRDFSRRKDEFLAMLGHELRNPLSAIQSAVTVLRAEELPTERATRAGDVIQRQLGNLARIVDDVLDVSRVTTGKVMLDCQPVDVNQLVQRWMQVFGETPAVRDHKLTMSLPLESLYVDGDPIRLEQVLSNLLSNALKYTPTGGRIEVVVTQQEPDVVVRVRDSGVGIDAETLPRVFELFTQAEVTLARSHGGLGLGLALVRSLVQLHGGSVSARSEGVGRGAEFEVRLPRIPAPLQHGGEVEQPEAVPPLRIVLVEDSDDGRETLRLVLEIAGHEVHVAADGISGRDLIVATKPDVALIDIGLPGIDGYEIARQVSEMADCEAPRLIAMTGYGQPEDKRRAIEAGFAAHMVKPLDPRGLQRQLAAVAEKSAFKKQHREPRDPPLR